MREMHAWLESDSFLMVGEYYITSHELVWQLLAAVFGTGKSGVNGPI